MSAFQSTKFFPVEMTDLTPVANKVMDHFKGKGYEVTGESTVTRGWHISITKGNIFKAVLGMRTALNVDIEPSGAGVTAKAGVGIFGQQVIPTLITMFVAWPVVLTQIWGLGAECQIGRRGALANRTAVDAHTGSSCGCQYNGRGYGGCRRR